MLDGRNDYLFIGRTVEEAVRNTRYIISADSGGGTDGADDSADGVDGSADSGDNGVERINFNRLTLDELEFFDIVGRRLEPVVVADRLEDLVIKTYQQEIRDRVVEVSHFVEQEIEREKQNDPDFNEQPLLIPDQALDFEEFIERLADKNNRLIGEEDQQEDGMAHFGSVKGCSWIRRRWGLC